MGHFIETNLSTTWKTNPLKSRREPKPKQVQAWNIKQNAKPRACSPVLITILV